MFFSTKNTHKFTFNWEFDLDFLKSLLSKSEENYTSKVFPVKGYEKLWFSFTLSPNEKDESGTGLVWIYFNCFTGYEEAKADLEFEVDKNGYKSEKIECTFATSGRHGIPLFDRKTLLDFKIPFLKHFEILSIKCNATITVKPYACNSCFLGNKLLNFGKKDLKIVIGENEIMAHKIILETFSPIFKKMIEARDSKDDAVIEITDCDFGLFKIGVDFCYGNTEKIPSGIDGLIEIMDFANKFEINDLKNEIEFKFMSQISKKNICKIANVAIQSNADSLKALCRSKLTKFVKNNDTKVLKEIEELDENFVNDVLQNIFIKEGYYWPSEIMLAEILLLFFMLLFFTMFIYATSEKFEERFSKYS